ncbi:hypothetical protein LXL04_016074 [Taraxacum kok-saghyz]
MVDFEMICRALGFPPRFIVSKAFCNLTFSNGSHNFSQRRPTYVLLHNQNRPKKNIGVLFGGVIFAIRVKFELRVVTPTCKKGKRGALYFFFPSRSIKGIKHHPPLRLPSSTATRSSTHVPPPSS